MYIFQFNNQIVHHITQLHHIGFLYPTNSVVGRYGKLRVDGIHLVSEAGDRVQLRGMSTHGPQWFDSCYNRDAFKALAEQWRVDVVRIAMYINEQGYNTNPSYWKGRIAQMVDWAEEFGNYVVIDWHMLTPGDPNDASYNEKWDFWGYISSKYAGKADVLYEICNEPNGVNWGQIENYAIPLINMIRSLEGSRHHYHKLWNVNPLQYNNIMYTLHFYVTSHYFQEQVKQQAARIPVFASEFGLDAKGDWIDMDNAERWIKVVNGENDGEQKISFINWSFSSADESYSALTAGSCESHSFMSTTQSGKWVMSKIQEAH